MEKQLFNYDETDIQSILDYSQYLLDRSLERLLRNTKFHLIKLIKILKRVRLQKLLIKKSV